MSLAVVSALQLKKAMLRKVVDAEKISADAISETDKQQLNLFSLESHFQTRLLEAKIRQKADALGVKTVINSDRIDQAIADEQENNRRVLAAVHQGREQINERVEA